MLMTDGLMEFTGPFCPDCASLPLPTRFLQNRGGLRPQLWGLLSSRPWGACLEPCGLPWDTEGLRGDLPGGKGHWAPWGLSWQNLWSREDPARPSGLTRGGQVSPRVLAAALREGVTFAQAVVQTLSSGPFFGEGGLGSLAAAPQEGELF